MARPQGVTEREPLLSQNSSRAHENGNSKAKNEYRLAAWKELWTLSKYTAPVFCTQMLEYSLFSTSVVAVGHISTTALAASSLGSMTAAVTGFSIIVGFETSLDTLLPAAWTSSHPDHVGLWAQRLGVVMVMVLIPIMITWANSEAILLLLRQEPEIAHLAGVYLKWSILYLPPFAFNNIARRYFQAQGLFTVPTRIVIVIAPINALLTYLLVWGPMPIRLGFIGAPIAIVLSFYTMAILNLLYGIYWTPKKAWHPFSRRSFHSLGVIVRLGLSGVGQIASEWWAWELMGLAASFLGPASLAAQSVIFVSQATTYQAPYALSVATSVRIGNLLGEANGKQARITAWVSLITAASMGAVIRHQWGYIFNDDPEVIALVSSILPVVALFQLSDALAGVVGGVFRACGRQLTGALLNLSAYYIIGIPLGLYLAFKAEMGLIGIWLGFTFALAYEATVGVLLCVWTNWEQEVRKVLDRAERERQAGEDTNGPPLDVESAVAGV
ncbi:mate-domain-containing protein [Hysterangium stoloniferum]|nr:mate-domain-containing protein [Hysterangium stoloniferum]